MPTASTNEEDGFDYSLIKDELLSLLLATANKLEREWPRKYSTIDSARIFFVTTIRLATNTYNTIVYICADSPEDFQRDRKYSLSIPPLNRTILENVMTIVFVLEDMQNYIEWFFKSGYVEWKEALDRYKNEYGQYPEWKAFIDKIEKFVNNPPAFLNLTQDETANPKKEIGYWPNPGKMPDIIRKEYPQSTSLSFIKFLNDWFYKALSGQSHLNMHGLIQRGKFFSKEVATSTFGDKADEVMEEALNKLRNDQLWISIILMLSLASEIEMHFDFGLDQRLKYIWGLVINYSGQAKDIYERRYKDL